MTMQADSTNGDDDRAGCQCGCHDEHQVDEHDVEVRRSCRWRGRAVTAGRAIAASVEIAKAITGLVALLDLIR
jgi:hypothetical protein